MTNQFFRTLKRKLFEIRVDREIFWKIFPQTEKTKNHGYTFTSDEELIRKNIQARFQFRVNLDRLNHEIQHMPKAYGEGFRHIAYRELNEHLEALLELAETRTNPQTDSADVGIIPAKC